MHINYTTVGARDYVLQFYLITVLLAVREATKNIVIRDYSLKVCWAKLKGLVNVIYYFQNEYEQEIKCD